MTRELGKVYHDTLRRQQPYKPAFDACLLEAFRTKH